MICFLPCFFGKGNKLTDLCRIPLGDPNPSTVNLSLAVVFLLAITYCVTGHLQCLESYENHTELGRQLIRLKSDLHQISLL